WACASCSAGGWTDIADQEGNPSFTGHNLIVRAALLHRIVKRIPLRSPAPVLHAVRRFELDRPHRYLGFRQHRDRAPSAAGLGIPKLLACGTGRASQKLW